MTGRLWAFELPIPDPLVLQAGEFCEFGTRAPVSLGSNRPISVMGILSGQASTGFACPGSAAGDPAIFLLPPAYQFRRDYAFLAPTTCAVDYLTVIAPADAARILDGRPVDLAGAEGVPGSTLVYLHIQIEDGPHRIEGDQPSVSSSMRSMTGSAMPSRGART